MKPTNIPPTNGHAEWGNPAASRAINASLPRAEVEALCAKHNAQISAIEKLPRGLGTRVVLVNSNDAAIMRRALGVAVIEGPVDREHWTRVSGR